MTAVFSPEQERLITNIANRVDLFTKEHLSRLKSGDTFSTEGIFQGVDQKRIKWELMKVRPLGSGQRSPPVYTFIATYFGIRLGIFEVIVRPKGRIDFNECQ